MDLLTRRDGLHALLASFATYALIGEARAGRPKGNVARWIDEQQHLAQALAGGRIKGSEWSAGVERLAAGIDVAELMASLSSAQVRPAPAPTGNDPQKRWVRFLDDQGQPRKLGYGVALFEFQPGNVITPHGHRHMVSAHMVVNGAFRVRNFDRVGDEDGAMLIRPTRDYVARTGAVSTMCSERDNVHWFVPQGGPAATFDVIIDGLNPGQPDYDIKAVDVLGGERLPDGLIRAPIIGFEEASLRYTAAA
jgi:hypothetical protein